MRTLIETSALRLARTRTSVEAFLRRFAWLSLMLDAYAAFGLHESQMAAAALSYYTILSLFPLILLLVALFSPFLASDEIVLAVTAFTRGFLPIGGNEVRDVLRQVIAARGAVGVAAAAGFAWSCAGLFDQLQHGLNRAWQVATPRPLWRARATSLSMVSAVVILFGASLALSAFVRTMSHTRAVHTTASRAIDIVGVLVSGLVSIVVFALLYRFGAHRELAWRDIWLGALFGGITWETSKELFTWYILNYAHLNLVYGSIGTVIGLLIWGYISASLLLFGAELDAARWRRKEMVLT